MTDPRPGRATARPIPSMGSGAAPAAARADLRLGLSSKGLIRGYASLFDTPDLSGDAVAPGAFSASLKRRGAGGIRMLWQHDPAEPIGRWLALREDERGLLVQGRLALDAGRGRDAAALVEAGAVDGLSIGYRTIRASPARDGRGRRLLEIDLWEISVVTFPMLPGARLWGAMSAAGAIRMAAARLSASSPRVEFSARAR